MNRKLDLTNVAYDDTYRVYRDDKSPFYHPSASLIMGVECESLGNTSEPFLVATGAASTSFGAKWMDKAFRVGATEGVVRLCVANTIVTLKARRNELGGNVLGMDVLKHFSFTMNMHQHGIWLSEPRFFVADKH